MQWARGTTTVRDGVLLATFWASILASPWPANGAPEEVVAALHPAKPAASAADRALPGASRPRRRQALPADLRAAGGRRPRRRRSADRRARQPAPARPRALAALPASDRPSLDLRRARGLARAVCRPPGRRPDSPARAAAPARRRRAAGRARAGLSGRQRPGRAGADAGQLPDRPEALGRRGRGRAGVAPGDRAAGRRRPAAARRGRGGAARGPGPGRSGRGRPRPLDGRTRILQRRRACQGAGARRSGGRALRPRRARDPLDRRDQRVAARQDPARRLALRDSRQGGRDRAGRTLARSLLGGPGLPARLQAPAGQPLPAAGRRRARLLWPAGAERAGQPAPPGRRPGRSRAARRRGAAALPRRPARAGARPGRRARARRGGDPQARGTRLGRGHRRADRARRAPRPAGGADAPRAEPRGPRARLPFRRALPGAELAAGRRLLARPGADLLDHARRVRRSIRRPRATPARAA